MKEFTSRCNAYQPDANGFVKYSDSDNAIWSQLYARQHALLANRACDDFIDGLESLKLSKLTIPQLPEVSRVLHALTGWQVVPVAALITPKKFFELLAQKQFPAATFIRSEDELNYVREPDIFHELFGHCPMLTNRGYANFVQNFAKMVLTRPETDWPLLQRLFWFTVEFGLIKTHQGLRVYGGGILSSNVEIEYCLTSDAVMRILFEPVVALRMPYRIDKLQYVYFVIENYEQLYRFLQLDCSLFLERARILGEYPPFFEVDEGNPSIHIHAC